MDNSRLIKKLEHIKERMQKASQQIQRKLKTGAIIASVGAATSVAPASRAAQPSAVDTSTDKNAIAMTLNTSASILLPENISTHRPRFRLSGALVPLETS